MSHWIARVYPDAGVDPRWEPQSGYAYVVVDEERTRERYEHARHLRALDPAFVMELEYWDEAGESVVFLRDVPTSLMLGDQEFDAAVEGAGAVEIGRPLDPDDLSPLEIRVGSVREVTGWSWVDGEAAVRWRALETPNGKAGAAVVTAVVPVKLEAEAGGMA